MPDISKLNAKIQEDVKKFQEELQKLCNKYNVRLAPQGIVVVPNAPTLKDEISKK